MIFLKISARKIPWLIFTCLELADEFFAWKLDWEQSLQHLMRGIVSWSALGLSHCSFLGFIY